ncbi:hypothetical protein [Nocardioides sp. zg-1228]|uniref:hypothetical protein n=1 Tax=Nocardioides sp. zg-1228 TaxID=2763008 RepID=UPI001642528D|nr:hypothetical protein [Nocardioides sp. zg-1228]MBC2931429.1 hypothetical protein [Nocardioides sp. zg-1228]QSF57043.1 hypothetical protein JX575_15905 [Nocardioides sp. zg-1228]
MAPGPTARPAGRRTRLRRPAAVVALLVVLAVAAAACVNLSLTSRMGRIDGAFDGLSGRPAPAAGDTILLVGTRPGGTQDVAWLPGEQSVESMMLVEVPADGRSALVESVSVRADAPVVDGPSAVVAAVESSTGRRVDHLVAIDWQTFAELAADNDVDATYRYGSAPGVQHDYLRLVLEGTLHAELRKQPHLLYRALRTTASGVAVDDTWSVLELDLLVLQLRDLRSADIRFADATG